MEQPHADPVREGMGDTILCACGCGGSLKELDAEKRPRRYLPGHHMKELWREYREATAKAIGKALRNEPSIDWLLENQDQIVHCFHQMALDGQI